MTSIKYNSILYGIMRDKLSILSQKKQQLERFQPLPPELLKNLDQWYMVELTYTSNAIEGNTLSRIETALVIEKGITVEGKTIREHLEAVNHAEAWNYVKSLTTKKRQDLTEKDILGIHRLILAKIDDTNSGRYRDVPVRIAGSRVILPNPVKVPDLMNEFMSWLTTVAKNHPVLMAAEAHYRMVTIHPFTDGNGRMARLLMNMLLMQAGYPAAIIRKEDRRQYINSIEKAQLGGSSEDFYCFIEDAVERSLDIYLEAVKETVSFQAKKSQLLKIGELAKRTRETVHTIRYWTQEGLLQVKELTPGGYQLYEPSIADKVKQIRRLQKEARLTLLEIKQRLTTDTYEY